ncbi:hypothetical protein ACQ4PT_007073 [Festuca glaucescens]
MDKKMSRKRRLVLIRAAASLASSMVMQYVRSRLRKKGKKKEGIAYGPIVDRDEKRIDFLNNQIYKDDMTCQRTLRLTRASFFSLCQDLRERSLLRDTVHICIEEQVAMFLITVGHNLRNRDVAAIFNRSGEPVSRYFGLVLHAIGKLKDELIRPPSLETPTKIAGDPRWDPYFKDCIGAIGVTHIQASASKNMETAFCTKKSFPSQNVMAAIDFDLRFTYVLAGWEGSAHDDAVLLHATERENGLHVPHGKFYLVDAVHGAKPGFLPPFRGATYHSNEWGNNHLQYSRELFNRRHSALQVTAERAFSSLKRRFKVLDDGIPFFPSATQVDVVMVCVILHNWVLSKGTDCFILPESNCKPKPPSLQREQIHDHSHMVGFRQALADKMWEDHQNYPRSDADFLNTPIDYHEMATSFGNGMASGVYAKSWGDLLAANVTENEHANGGNDTSAASVEDFTLPFTIPRGGNIGESSSSRAPKRAKLDNDDELTHLMTSLDNLTKAIEKSKYVDVPEDLWGNLMDLPGFEEAHLTHYYAHLVENPAIAWSFNKLSMSNKTMWVVSYIKNHLSV